MPSTKRQKREANVMYTFRLAPSLVGRLDAHADRLSAATPGLTISRADALRIILANALDAAERKAKGR